MRPRWPTRGGGRTDGRTSGNSPLCPTGHWPFGAAAQKEEEEEEEEEEKEKVKSWLGPTYCHLQHLKPLFFHLLGSGPKGPMSCRTQGGISIRPSVCPSFRPPPVGHQGLKFALPALNLALQASNQPSRLQISPPPPQI